VAVSDCVERTDTLAFAHVKLPALAWGEKDGTVTNSERRISRQRPAFEAPGAARADWRIIADVAAAMGFGEAFAWRSPWEVFREYARLTAFENGGGRPLNLGPLAAIGARAYAGLEPVQWPVTEKGGTARLFTDGRFPTPDGRARMIPLRPKGPAAETSPAFPFALNTGRIRDQWHTMTRTGLAPGLCRHIPEPFVEIHPEDAAAAGIADGALTRVITRRAEAVVEARVTDRPRRGSLFMPMHWTDAFAPQGRANGLIGPHVDPQSGQPEFKHAPAKVSAYRETWRGFFLARGAVDPPKGLDLIWRRIPRDDCHQHEFAGRGDAKERASAIAALFASASGEVVSFEDEAAGTMRRAAIVGDQLERALFVTAEGRLPGRDWLAGLFAGPLDVLARAALLAGRAPGAAPDRGPIICACMGVATKAIAAAVAAGAGSVDAVAAATGAGANCGSCRTEIKRLISSTPDPGVRHAA
jgi:assimilatory nitrate reductase catalytic subunit